MGEDKLIYDGWLKLYERDIDGRKYCIINNYDAVGCIIINNNNEILLVKQFRPTVMRNTLEIPAGCLDVPGEDPVETAVRELKEETKLLVEDNDLEKVFKYNSNIGFCTSYMTLYFGKIDKPVYTEEDINEEDVTKVIWMPLKAFEGKIKNEEITDNKTIMSYLILKNKHFIN